jgi:hypothetical protein
MRSRRGSKGRRALGEAAFWGPSSWPSTGIGSRIELRVEAARAAIGYEKPRLSSVDSSVEGAGGLGDPRMVERARQVLQARLQARQELTERGELGDVRGRHSGINVEACPMPPHRAKKSWAPERKIRRMSGLWEG